MWETLKDLLGKKSSTNGKRKTRGFEVRSLLLYRRLPVSPDCPGTSGLRRFWWDHPELYHGREWEVRWWESKSGGKQ